MVERSINFLLAKTYLKIWRVIIRRVSEGTLGLIRRATKLKAGVSLACFCHLICEQCVVAGGCCELDGCYTGDFWSALVLGVVGELDYLA